MASPVNADILRIVIHNRDVARSQRSANTLYYVCSDVVGDFTFPEIAAAMSGMHAILYKPWQSAQTSYAGTSVYREKPNPTPEVFSAWAAGPGTAGGLTIPTQVTGLISGQEAGYHTGSFTEKHPEGTLQSAEARLFISFPSTTFLDVDGTGRMSESGLTCLQTIAQTLFSVRTLVGSGKSLKLTPVIKSIWYDKTVTPVTKVITYINVSVLAASRRWATQKSRGDRGQREETD